MTSFRGLLLRSAGGLEFKHERRATQTKALKESAVMRKKAPDEARVTINLGPAIFSQLNEQAHVLHAPVATLAASYVEERLGRKRFAVDREAEIEKLKKELADYKQHHQMEINSLTTELTRLKAALDFEAAPNAS